MTTGSSIQPPAVVRESLRPALALRVRPPRPSGLSASLTFGWRTLLKIKHVPEQLTDVVAIPIIFTVMFTYLFGGAVAGSTSGYLQFLLPGTLVMTVVMVTMYAGVALNSDITKGVFDRFRSLPIWRPAPIVGAMLGDAGRYVLASTVVTALGLVLGFRPEAGAVGVLSAIALVLVFAFSLSWLWTVIGLVMRTPSSVMSVGFLIQFPLTLASNVFVDPGTTPTWVRAFINANPVSQLVTAVRGLMHGTATASQVVWVLVASALLVGVFAPLTMHLYRNKQ